MKTAWGNMKGFIITAAHETDRAKRVAFLLQQFPQLTKIEAIYPALQKIPFKEKLQQHAKQRTGHALNDGELGVLLTSRKIWRAICDTATSDTETFLILESDSWINEPELLHQYFDTLTTEYDMFFFGAWLGNVRIFRSTQKKLEKGYYYGAPFIKTISGGYGYALNKKAAAHLLKTSARIAYPADEFKYYVTPGFLKMGAVKPEMISEKSYGSFIGERPHTPAKQKIKMQLLNIRNSIIAFLG
ncbi:MAG: glycosyltransferase family 25 protein [Sediminibacterium sp.]|nr:glycosyltransferase family 25 protein [Sediminibacterium sp.]